jgi:hypothetical protein
VPEPAPPPAEPTPPPAAPPAPPEERRPAVQRTRFDLPISPEAAADPERLRELVVAVAGPQPDDAEPPRPGPRGRTRPAIESVEAWKCREAQVWSAPEGAVVRWQRFVEEPCGGTADRWWVERVRASEARPERLRAEGRLVSPGLTQVRTRAGEGWSVAYETASSLEQAAFRGAFPFDAAWLAEAAGAPISGAPAVARSERWALARAVVAREKITFVLDRWTCADGRVIGAALSFETVRRMARRDGRPGDAVPSPKVRDFADELANRLGAVVGGPPAGPVEALRCAP